MEVRVKPAIVVSFSMPPMSVDDFFDEEKIIDNIAALLGIASSKIRVVNVVRESRRRKRETIEGVSLFTQKIIKDSER